MTKMATSTTRAVPRPMIAVMTIQLLIADQLPSGGGRVRLPRCHQ